MYPEARYQSKQCHRCQHDYLWPAYGGEKYCGTCADEKKTETYERTRIKNQVHIRQLRAQRKQLDHHKRTA